MAATIDLPKIDLDFEQQLKDWAKELRSWNVILYNDDYHRKVDVVLWLQKATGCSLQAADQITETAHRTGRAIAFSGDKDKCAQVAAYLRGKGLQVEVDQPG